MQSCWSRVFVALSSRMPQPTPRERFASPPPPPPAMSYRGPLYAV
ncbi:unnamed protein product, partial [Iphiclides podalirius]